MAWRRDQGKDRFFKQARDQGYRARSAFKLLKLARTFRLLPPGARVVDLGAAPGSWSQVAIKAVGPRGKVVAVDLQKMEPIPGVIAFTGDILEPATWAAIQDALGGCATVVLSDAAPSTTGIAVTDHARSIELAEASLAAAGQLLCPGGNFVVKVFRGPDFDAFLVRVRRQFAATKATVPEATHRESKEAFVIGTGFKALTSA